MFTFEVYLLSISRLTSVSLCRCRSGEPVVQVLKEHGDQQHVGAPPAEETIRGQWGSSCPRQSRKCSSCIRAAAVLFTLRGRLLIYPLFISSEKEQTLSSSANRAVSVITAKPLKGHG